MAFEFLMNQLFPNNRIPQLYQSLFFMVLHRMKFFQFLGQSALSGSNVLPANLPKIKFQRLKIMERDPFKGGKE